MPGTRLSNTEKKLLKWWETGAKTDYPMLRSIEVNGDPGLRGIKNTHLKFNYPLTVISGCNGSGKATLLSLAALAFHRVDGHVPLNSKKRKGKPLGYYKFPDFFHRGPSDPKIEGVKITWSYSDETSQVVSKTSDRWMRYERRPNRPCHYIGVSRCVPSIEKSVLKSYFGSNHAAPPQTELNDEYKGYLAEVLGRPYESAHTYNANSYDLRACTTGSTYSSFNMGAGEDIVIELLHLLQEIPKGSLVAIEEIDLGLHPNALVNLAKVLQDIISKKKIQIIVSTHSQYFIDSVPRIARVFLQRNKSNHEVHYSPSTRMAIGNLTGVAQSEVNVYCEDVVMYEIIKTALSGEQRKRVSIFPVGTKDALVDQALHHQVGGISNKLLIIWDGDVTAGEISKWLKDKPERLDSSLIDPAKISWVVPSGTDKAPEEWLVEVLDDDQGFTAFEAEHKLNAGEASGLFSLAKTPGNHHGAFFPVAQQLSVDEEDVRSSMIRCADKHSKNPFNEIREAVEAVLNGEVVTFPPQEG